MWLWLFAVCTSTAIKPELLKVEVVRSHSCAIFLRICAFFFTFEPKTGKKRTFLWSAPLGQFNHRVAMSVEMSVCLSVCLRHRVQFSLVIQIVTKLNN